MTLSERHIEPESEDIYIFNRVILKCQYKLTPKCAEYAKVLD
jgi:hypothetical protein